MSITLLLEITSPAALHTLDPTVRFPIGYKQPTSPTEDGFLLLLLLSRHSLMMSLSSRCPIQNAQSTLLASLPLLRLRRQWRLGSPTTSLCLLAWGEGTAQVWQRPPLTDSTPASSARPSAEPAGWREASSGPGAERGGSAGLPTGRTPLGPAGSEAMSQGPRQPLLPLRQVFRVGFLTPLSVLQRTDGEVPGSPF